jgi:pyruvate dehydrogenase E1 component
MEAAIVKGGYALRTGAAGERRATLLGSGTILRECLAAAEMLEQQFSVRTDVLSITSFSELRREALECQRWNLLHPGDEPRVPYVQTLLGGHEGPIVAATDYVRNVPDQIRPWVSAPYVALGTDGFGRSDARAELRRHFEVDRNFITLAALKALADAGHIERSVVVAALQALGIDPDKADPINA